MILQIADSLHPTSLIFALGVFLLAIFTAFALNKIVQPAFAALHSRYETIDGLRGLLGISVFIHHASIWHQYLQTGTWTLTKSNLFNHFGQTSVSLFFMISAFLFTSKLLKSRHEKFDWPQFFISRIFRLVPMYYAALAVIILFVMILSNWQLNGSFPGWLASVFRLMTFEVLGETVLNQHPLANLINAKITWTLRFEWLFYFSLPLISLLILKKRPSGFYLLLSTVFIAAFYKYHGLNYLHDYLSFAGGMLAAFMVNRMPVLSGKNNIAANIIILICFLAIPFFKTSDDIFCKTLIFLIFLLIVSGADLFGIFRSHALKTLGEICYSTYLLHGILLFSVLYFGLKTENAKQLSPTEFCEVIFLITPFLVTTSYLGFRFIEQPAIMKARHFRLNNKKEAEMLVATEKI